MILLIVESPNKIKTIKKYIGNQYRVEASVGHIRDLPDNQMGLDDRLHPMYVNTKPDVIKKLRDAVKQASETIIMTDLDREGEAIGWHLVEVLNLGNNYSRCSTNNLTQQGIINALNNRGKLNLNFVHSQEARRVLDRLIGFRVSKYTQSLLSLPSAGRVQSTALRLLVDRQYLINKFNKQAYLDLVLTHTTGVEGVKWHSKLDVKAIIQSNLFNDVLTETFSDDSGKQHPQHIKNPQFIQAIQQAVFQRGQVSVKSFSTKPSRTKALPPFVTSTLLQAASTKLGLSADKAMSTAQALYEAGLITYHRTDCPNYDAESLKLIRSFISQWQQRKGTNSYLPAEPNTFKAKEGAQEGHEAIRPSILEADISSISDPTQKAMYQMIFCRTIASQMSDAQYNKTDVILSAGFAMRGLDIQFIASGRMMTFDGWKAIYKDNDDDDEDDSLDNLAEQTIPQLIQNESVPVRQVDIEKKHTKPPSRYTEATLIKALENRGIGRPSTYASIMKTLYVRLYMDNDKRFIYPTDRGIKLVDSLKDTFQFLQYEYTANMENEIDRIAQGQSTYDHIIPKANSDLEYEIKSFIKARTQHQPLIDCPICKEKGLIQRESTKKNKFWTCLTDNCEAYYPDVNGQPNLDYTPPQLTKFACESCKKPLILSNPKEGNPNRYFYCSVPKCKFITKAKMENTDWIPDLSEYIRDHQHQCPKCQKNYLKFIISREHQNKLWVCQGSPRCKTFLDDLNGAPDIEAFRQKQLLENSLIDCPSCGKGKLRKSKNKENLFYCSNISLKGKSKCKTFINGNENGEPDIDGWKEGTKGGAAIKVNTNMTEESKCPSCSLPLRLMPIDRVYRCPGGHVYHVKSDGTPDFDELNSLQKKRWI